MTDTGFWARTFTMPLRPSLWSQAAHGRMRDVVFPLVLLTATLHVSLACLRTWQMRGELRRWTQRYDTYHPGVTVTQGRVRVDGDAVIQFSEEGKTFLVDPKETIALESISTPEYVVVRERTIIRKRPFGRNEIIDIADAQALFGDPIRIDSRSLKDMEARFGLMITLGIATLVIVFLLVREIVGVLIYVPVTAAFALVAVGQRGGFGYGACVRVALAAYSTLVALDFAAHLAGWSPDFCIGILVWPALLMSLTLWGGWGVARTSIDVQAQAMAAPAAARGSTAGPMLRGGGRISRRRQSSTLTVRLLQVFLVVIVLAGLVGAVVAYRHQLSAKADTRARAGLTAQFEGFDVLAPPEVEQMLAVVHRGCFDAAYRLRLVSDELDDEQYAACVQKAVRQRVGRLLTLHSPQFSEAPDPKWWLVTFIVDGDVPEKPIERTWTQCEGEGEQQGSSQTHRDLFDKIGERRYRTSTMVVKRTVPCRHSVVLAYGAVELGAPLNFESPPPTPAPSLEAADVGAPPITR